MILLLLAHPNPASFNHAIAARCLKTLRGNGHEVCFHDLYAEGFDPRLPADELPDEATLPPDIRRYCEELASTEGIVIVHPNWWGQPPAILKGWVDRIFRAGLAYRFLEGDCGEGVLVGLLQARGAVVLNTSNTPASREELHFGDPLELLWKTCLFELCGIKVFYRRMFRVVVTSTLRQRER